MQGPKLTYHDFWIRLIGYGFLIVGWTVSAGAALMVLLQLTGTTIINRNTGQPASLSSTLMGAALMIAVSAVFILVGRWITGNYRTGRRSGF